MEQEINLNLNNIAQNIEDIELHEEGSIDFSMLPKHKDHETDDKKQIQTNLSCFKLSDDREHFAVNNWIEKPHPTLQLIDEKGAAVWMYEDGEFAFRRTSNSKVRFKLTKSKLITVLSKLIGKVVVMGDNEDNKEAIKSFDLLMVSDDVFNPFVKQEFFEKDGMVFRNTFRPTRFMELDKTKSYKQPQIIIKLLNHLTRNDTERYTWVINWLSYFFQGLKKSPVALFFKGVPGGGKGLCYDDIIVPLFGEKQTIQVNDKTMKGDFLGSIVEGRLVMNLDEISSGTQNNKEFKNQLKALISNRGGTFQKKHVNTEEETPLYAMIIITSNEPKALEVESKDRRLTVFETFGNIAETNFLGLGDYHKLVEAITNELEDFAMMLLNYDVDVKLATTAMNTPEKEALVGVTSNRFKTFSDALKKMDKDFFEDLKDDSIYDDKYNQLLNCFRKYRLSRKLLKHVYGKLYGPITTNALMEQLTAIDPVFFNKEKNAVKDSSGDYLFRLDTDSNNFFTNNMQEDDSFTLNTSVQAPSLYID